MNGRKLALLALVAVALLAAALFLFPRESGRSIPGKAPRESAAATPAAGEREPAPAAASRLPSATPVPPPASPLTVRIEDVLQRLLRGDASGDLLAALRRELLGADPREAIAAILGFLGSGRDAATQQPFTIGEGSALEGAPTLRVALMDLLGRLSRRTGSADAAGFARRTLETKRSADEWAVSLRNVAWHEPAAAPYLAGKMREMLAHVPWAEQPSDGMLEAFDVIVFSRDPSFVPTLAGLLRGGAAPLQRASAVALDRLGEATPLAVMSYLNSSPGELADRPFLRADYFAKADLSQPAQRSAVETYLARADVSTAEKTKLLKGLAMPASFVSPSPNLLTDSAPPEESPARQEALQKTLAEWAAARRFPELQPSIEQVRDRLGR